MTKNDRISVPFRHQRDTTVVGGGQAAEYGDSKRCRVDRCWDTVVVLGQCRLIQYLARGNSRWTVSGWLAGLPHRAPIIGTSFTASWPTLASVGTLPEAKRLPSSLYGAIVLWLVPPCVGRKVGSGGAARYLRPHAPEHSLFELRSPPRWGWMR